MSERLTGKIGLVTGAGSGIGRACAIALAREGAQIALVGRRRERLEQVAHDIGAQSFPISADVSQSTEIQRLIDETVHRFGGLNFLVNNAGILQVGNAEQITEAQRDRVFNVNVRAVWLLSRAVLPYMRNAGGGSIINIASTLGIVGARNRAAYASSKGAVVLLTKSMAIDHGHENIRVNAICPSFVETELTAPVLATAPDPLPLAASERPPIPSVASANLRMLQVWPCIWRARNLRGQPERFCRWMAAIWRCRTQMTLRQPRRISNSFAPQHTSFPKYRTNRVPDCGV